jgi:hypothetical protein
MMTSNVVILCVFRILVIAVQRYLSRELHGFADWRSLRCLLGVELALYETVGLLG